MISRYRVSIDNIQLDNVDDRIIVLDIQYPEPGISATLETYGGRDGANVSRLYRQKASASVSFAINAYNTKDRNEVLQKVIKWAKSGSTLRTNDRQLQYLSGVMPEQYPAMSVKQWTGPLTIVFSSYAFPYWEDDNQVELSLSGSNQSSSMTIPGNADSTRLTGAITASGAITWIKIITSITTLYLTGLTLANGDVVNIDYDERGNLRIRNGNTSLLNKRTADSDDELLIPCGTSTVTVQASGSVSAVMKARGCWY